MHQRRPRALALTISAVIGCVVLLAGCGGRFSIDRSIGYLADREAPAPEAATALVEVERFVLMPVSDERQDDARFESVDVGRHVRDAAQLLLSRKGYAVLEREFFDDRGRPAESGVGEMSGEDLAALGPQGERTLLFISVRDVEEGYDRGGEAFRVALSGVVVDAETRRVVWRSSATGTSNLGGLLKAFVRGQGQYDAVYEALRDMFQSVPERTV